MVTDRVPWHLPMRDLAGNEAGVIARTCETILPSFLPLLEFIFAYSPDFWRTANDGGGDPGSPTTRHGAGRSLGDGTRSDALDGHDRDHGARFAVHCSAIDDGSACTVAPGLCHGRADVTSARVLRWNWKIGNC
ncbi:uncharacterized protein LOC143182865 isoform X1 [Calliopsis andreniformis]|uniref:uncharacterized protein LOC143182865 isoform X1 n=1 Tax=Calliopsis andreniformis TaxID=337506 RepID=UPI003FCD1CF7